MNLLGKLNDFLWTWAFLPCLLVCGLLLTVRCRALPFRRFGLVLRVTLGGEEQGAGGGLSSFQAASTALAATVGTGNIVGTAQALAMGGPGAVFWLWIAAALGMSVKYAELYLCQRYRQRDRLGRPVGGPMSYIRQGLGPRFAPLAGAYAALAAVSALSMGNLAQINTAVSALSGAAELIRPLTAEERFLLRLALGFGLALLTGVLLSGGAGRVGRASALLVPLMSLLYLGVTAAVVLRGMENLPRALGEIFTGAFRPRAVLGAASGIGLREALEWGVRRGAFSNEAGLGSAAIAHGSVEAASPAVHGLWGIFEVFADTVVLCTATALAILCSGVPIPWGSRPGPELLGAALGTVFGPTGAALLLAAALSLFGFSTVTGCSVYGLRCLEYLFGERAEGPYRLVYTACVLLGSVLSAGAVWTAADTVNVLLSLPNFLALFALSGQVSRAVRRQFFSPPGLDRTGKMAFNRRRKPMHGGKSHENHRQLYGEP